jgi:hypothetical protein
MGADRGGAVLPAAIEGAGGQQPIPLDPDHLDDTSSPPLIMVDEDRYGAAGLEAHEVEDHGERHHPGRQLEAPHEIPAVVAGVAGAELREESD